MSDDKPVPIEQERITKAIDAGVPQIYFNGFVNNITSGDVLTILERNGKPVIVLNMSYTIAKTLAVALGQIISQFESGVERNVLTTYDVERALKMQAAEGAKKETKQ